MKYKQDEIVNYNNGVVWGTGKIVGQSSTELPVIGISYIIENLKSNIPIPNEGYSYTHFVVFECHIKSIKE
jgi:hypothetical protein